MTENQANKIYDLLVLMGGANESEREMFIHHHCKGKYLTNEFRFRGKFGFGGKYRRLTNKVTYYREDETPNLAALAKEINTKLAKII